MMNNPGTWIDLLSTSPAGSILAGGAIRDYTVGKEAKDYDVFHTYQPGLPVAEDTLHWKYIPRDQADTAKVAEDYFDAGGENKIASVYDYDVITPSGLVRVQMIGVHFPDPQMYMSSFDHTLTLGLFGKQGLFIDARLFDSVLTKTVTALPGSKGEKSLNRAKLAAQRVDPEGVLDWTFNGF